METNSIENYMSEAIAEAKKAAMLGEVPVGCVIVHDGKIIARSFNSTESDKDPTAHAEIKAIKLAAKALGGWRLVNSQMYVTVEPCAMCAGAIVLARIDELYIGTMDPKMGACGSVNNIVEDDRLNHQVKVTKDVCREECSNLMKTFFKKLRC